MTAKRTLVDALRERIRGEVRFDAQSRGLYSMDASNYRHPPLGVVVPRDVGDVEVAVETCRYFGAPVVSRGGGTGLAGQSLNTAVVIDHSKYLREVLQIDADRRLARVRAGTILDELRHKAQEHGLTFGPDPATHDRCTFGGMIGNNACGVHAMLAEMYGPGPRTEDNVATLDVLTYDGLRLEVGPTSDAAYELTQRTGGRKAEIYRRLRTLAERHGDAIRRGFPKIPRRVSGYNLPALLPENGFNVAAALVGSEGTCITLLEATVKLSPHFAHQALVVLGYDSVFEAADDAPRVRSVKPIGLEGIDERLVELIRTKGMHARYTELLPEGKGWLIVEIGGDTAEEAHERAHQAMERLANRGPRPSAKLITDRRDQTHLWKLRESALGATAFVPGQPDTWPGWEDSAVAVDQLGSYLRELDQLYDRYDYIGALYGHFGQGCVHTRISFDLTTRAGIAKYERFTREAAELCLRHGGSLSGEHGDGQSRSDLLPLMYGPEIMHAFREFKAIWDPLNKLNPGRIVEPMARVANLRLAPQSDGWRPETRFAFPEDKGDFAHATLRCVGVGACRADSEIMCPSYMVTHEEEHTTRGRARLLYEMVRGDVIADRWQSEEVKDSLELCLSCKGCKHDCPVSVDMATYKAEFLSHYYEKKRRPRQAYTMGWIHRWLRLGTRVPLLANLAMHTPGLAWLAKKIGGIATDREVPRLAPKPFRRVFERHHRPRHPDPARQRVLLWLDCFNNAFYPQTLAAVTEVLEAAGCDVVIPEQKLCCGRALYDYGMLDLADRLWRDTLEALEPELDRGTRIVGVEPSCVAAFRDELPNLFPDDRRARILSQRTHTVAELLLHHLDGYEPPQLPARALFHGHCHQRSIMGIDPDHELLQRMQIAFDVPQQTCCGMAGSFGFEAGKFDVSKAIGERNLAPAVRDAGDDTLIIADGFSCREQIEQLAHRRALHLGEVVWQALRTGERARPPTERETPGQPEWAPPPGPDTSPPPLGRVYLGMVVLVVLLSLMLYGW